MKTAIIFGLGSMGKRRIRDLISFGVEVIGYDIRKDRMTEAFNLFQIKTINDLSGIDRCRIDFAVICTPPDKHIFYYELCFTKKLFFFSEANIFTPKASWFIENEKKYGVKGFPSGTWRFHPAFIKLKELLVDNTTQLNSVRLNYTEFLPDWHPWEKYEDYYAGQEKTCAAREMVTFEFDALVFLFGRIDEVCCICGSTYPWKTNIKDFYNISFKFESGLTGSIVIELSSVVPKREIIISCFEKNYSLETSSDSTKTSQGSIAEYNYASDSWKYYYPESRKIKGGFDFEEVYTNEIEMFYNAISTKKLKYPKSWEDDRHLSNILFASEESDKKGKWIKIKDVENKYVGDKL
jgi:predicted dehydrogenase